MIEYVKGSLTEASADRVVLEAGGLGYGICVTAGFLEKLPPYGSEVKLYTYYQIAEDARRLFGFESRSEREVFLLLLKTNGVGPKLAMSVLSALGEEELRVAVTSGDLKTLCRVPGLGKKTAEKLVLELRDKLEPIGPVSAQAGPAAASVLPGGAAGDALAALVALGYSAAEASRTIRSLEAGEEASTEELLQQALQQLARF